MPWTTSNRLFKFAVPLGLTEAIGILNKRLDRFLVVGLFAAAVVAEYEVGAWQIPLSQPFHLVLVQPTRQGLGHFLPKAGFAKVSKFGSYQVSR